MILVGPKNCSAGSCESGRSQGTSTMHQHAILN
jgi:hypothetical protein